MTIKKALELTVEYMVNNDTTVAPVAGTECFSLYKHSSSSFSVMLNGRTIGKITL